MESSFYNKSLIALGEPAIAPWSGGRTVAFSLTHVGMVRDSNQDSHTIDQSLGLYMVADGVGGHAGGELASSLAVEVLTEQLRVKGSQLLSADLPLRGVLLEQIINMASLKIYERSLEVPQYRGMGTTTTLLWIPPPSASLSLKNVALVAHVGDSRCYLLRAGLLYQVTEDHSLINEQIKSGALQKSDPMIAQMRNVITRCVGYKEEEEVDIIPVQLFAGDRFLLCSDGLSSKVSEGDLVRVLACPAFETVPQILVDMANAAGGEDNVTVLVVEVQN